MRKFRNSLMAIVAIAFVLSLAGNAIAASSVSLNSASNFAILAGSTVTNTGSSVVSGDLGLSPGASVTGFPPGVLNGTQHIADAMAIAAKADLTSAYNNAAGQAPAVVVPTELGSTTKAPGVYSSASGTFGLTGPLTLDAQGDPNAVFIFQTDTTLITGGASSIILANGAQACNVFWKVGSSATLGASSIFKGNILASASITLTTGANVEGRVFAQSGAVTLDSNTVNKAVCAVPPPAPAPVPAPVVPPVAPVVPVATSSSPVVIVPPLISVEKVPTPLALPNGAGSVVFDYTVANVGTIPMSNITASDDKCSNVIFLSGDTNNDLKLDLSEIWKYRCTSTLSLTTTNTVTVTGQASGFTAIDTANATVVVGVASPAPLIHLIKRPNKFVLASSGPIIYSYTVTNPGTVSLSNVSVVDDKCAPVSMGSGDVNGNNLLDVSETWSYSCQMNLTTNTVNRGTAQGSANGLTAIDYSFATVVVTPPKLPSAGIIPTDRGDNLSVFVAYGAILAALAVFGIARRKQII